MEKLLGWVHKLGGVESHCISRVGQIVLNRLMESQIWHLPAGSITLLGGTVQKRVNGLCLPYCMGVSCPPALALMSNTLFPPHMPLVLFNDYSGAGAQREQV